jgi:hypothetical protein
MMDWFSKSEWSGFEATAIAWGAIAATAGSWWLGVVFWLAAFVAYVVRTRGE